KRIDLIHGNQRQVREDDENARRAVLERVFRTESGGGVEPARGRFVDRVCPHPRRELEELKISRYDDDAVHVLCSTKALQDVVEHRIGQGSPVGVAQVSGETALRNGEWLGR